MAELVLAILFSLSAFSQRAFAQSAENSSDLPMADASTQVLLQQSSSATSDPSGDGAEQKPSGLRSGRYQMKPGTDDDKPVYHPRAQHRKKLKAKKLASDEPPIPVKIPEAKPEPNFDAPEISESNVPGTGDQLLDIFKGGKEKTADTYRAQLHPDDVRNNRVELEADAGMIYNGASSNLSYRNYYSFANYLAAGASLWIMPLVGISGSYQSTFSETIPATNAASTSVNVQSQWTKFSLDFRKFFGVSRKANSLNYGLMYSDYKMVVSASELTRSGLDSQGVGVYLNVRIPTAPSYAWTFGGNYIPSVNLSETQTALGLQSGNSVSGSRTGLFLGGEIKLSRQNQLIWDLGLQTERDQFSGPSNKPDPVTGQTLTGVNLTNTWSYFHLGYRWGQ